MQNNPTTYAELASLDPARLEGMDRAGLEPIMEALKSNKEFSDRMFDPKVGLIAREKLGRIWGAAQNRLHQLGEVKPTAPQYTPEQRRDAREELEHLQGDPVFIARLTHVNKLVRDRAVAERSLLLTIAHTDDPKPDPFTGVLP